MASSPRRLRAADVPNIPVPDDISGYELVDGELVPVMGSHRRHAWLCLEIANLARTFVQAEATGEIYLDVWCRLKLVPAFHWCG